MTKVFKASRQSPAMNACLRFRGGIGGMEAAASGYRMAFEVLLAEVLDRGGTLDALVYPIVYNWRHFVELKLKLIILNGQVLQGELMELPKQRMHDIKSLWAIARRVALIVRPDCDRATLSVIDVHINQLGGIDPDSHVFRYTLDKALEETLPPNLTHIGMSEFSEVTKEVAGLLEGIAWCLDEALEHRYGSVI